jgi:type III secretion protein J
MSNAKGLAWPKFIHFFTHLIILALVMSLTTSCESRRTIVNGLDEREANEILVFLANKGISANKEPAGGEGGGGGGGGGVVLWNISVEETQATEAMALLNQAGLPRKRGQNLLNIFSNTGLVPSGMHEKVRYQAGLAEQIASTIRKIDGVLDADVQISFPEEDPLNPTAPTQKITASVYIKHTGILDDPNAHLVTRIKRLVAGSVPGLDFDNVTVIGDRARYSESPISGLGGSLTEEEKSLTNVWSITLAKESLTRFRILFFSFTISLLILLLLLLWLLWKFLPLIKQLGLKELVRFHSIHPEDFGTQAPAVAQEAPVEETKPKEEDTAGRDIDET